MNSLIIHLTLIGFMALFYHDIPLEWQGFTGFVVGAIATWNVMGGHKDE